MTISPWTFSDPSARAGAGAERRVAQVTLAVFGQGPLAPAVGAHDVQTIARVADPRWFDAWRTGSLRAIAEQDLGEGIGALDAADHVHMLSVEVTSPADLGYLQEAWARARSVVARGGAVVLDVHAMAFVAGSALPAPEAALDVAREVRTIYETTSTRPDHAHAIHTRGLKKFGARDLIALCSDADARLVGHAMRALADRIARGLDILAAPAHAVEIAPGITWYLVDDEHHLAELLQLNNTAHVLVDGQGHDLVGVLGRLPRGNG